jgi:phage baseplate assembly protein W
MDLLAAPFPIVKNPLGLLAPISGLAGIKGDLIQLILTNPGDRVMLPTFGTPLRSLLFEPNTEVLSERAKSAITNAIQTWEPRIVVNSLEVENSAENASLPQNDAKQNLENFLSIKISFSTFNNIDVVENLVLQVPIGEA